MSGNSPYPRAPVQGYTANYQEYPANVQYQQQPVNPPTGYVPTGYTPVGYAPTGYSPAGPSVPNAPAYTDAPPPYTERPENPPVGIQQTMVFKDGFDYRARFDGIAQPRIPPPPPGVAPNAAQIASMQGHNVTATQEHRSVFW